GGQAGGENGGVLGLVADQTVIDVGVDLAGGEFISLGGIERDDVIDILGNDQSIGGRGGIDGAGCQRQRQCSSEQCSLEELHTCFSFLTIFLFFTGSGPGFSAATAGRGGLAEERKRVRVPVQSRRAGRPVWVDQAWGRLPRECRLSPALITLSSVSRRAGRSVWLDQEWGRLPRKCRLSPALITISSLSRRWVMAPSST